MKLEELKKIEGPVMIVPIGPSGCGKSTLYAELSSSIPGLRAFSLDTLRREWYSGDAREAFKMSIDDKQFEQKAHKAFMDMMKSGQSIFIDNTNLSVKRRAPYLTEGRKRNFTTVAVHFIVEPAVVFERQLYRGDKQVPEHAVKQQFASMQLPSLGEFDHIVAYRP